MGEGRCRIPPVEMSVVSIREKLRMLQKSKLPGQITLNLIINSIIKYCLCLFLFEWSKHKTSFYPCVVNSFPQQLLIACLRYSYFLCVCVCVYIYRERERKREREKERESPSASKHERQGVVGLRLLWVDLFNPKSKSQFLVLILLTSCFS